MTTRGLDSDARPAALVIFGGETGMRWLNTLKPGFRHCFVAIKCERHWVFYNPLSHQTDIAVYPGVAASDLVSWYRGQGFAVVETTVGRAPPRPAPWRPFTCVEAVKRVLGIRAPRVFTP